MEILKKIYKKLLLVLAYTAVASMVYGYWFHSLWHLWYVTLLTVLVICIIGAVGGYFYVRNDIKPAPVEPKVDTPKEVEVENLTVEENNETK